MKNCNADIIKRKIRTKSFRIEDLYKYIVREIWSSQDAKRCELIVFIKDLRIEMIDDGPGLSMSHKVYVREQLKTLLNVC